MVPSTWYIFFLLIGLSTNIGANFTNPFSQKQPSFDTQDKKKTPRKNPLAEKPFAELKKGKEQALKAKDLQTAAKYLDAMRMTCNDTELLKDILLEMADVYYEQKEWTKAEKAYKEYMLLYPGSIRCDYAHYRAIDCGMRLTLIPERDQTQTEETLVLAQEFLDEYPKSVYLNPVTQLAFACKDKLFKSDVNIFNFYLHSNNVKAATKRLDLIMQERLPQLPEYQPQTLELSIQLAQAQNNTETILRKQLELGQKFPEHEITKRLVTNLPAIQIQLASLEQAKFADVEMKTEASTEVVV
jgi:outer membrane assembly lipoprotein YfiO